MMTESGLQKRIEFAELLQQHHSDIFSFIYSLVLNQSDSEDLYQETVSVLWQKFDSFEPGTNFRSWAIRVAQLKVLNFVRLHHRRRMIFSEVAIDAIAEAHHRDAMLRSSSRTDALKICMQKLPPNELRLLHSRYSSARSIPDIAAEENRSLAAIYKALGRIRRALLVCIERQLAVESR